MGKELVIAIQVQTYGDDEDAVLEQIRQTVISVVELCDISVGTFTVTSIQDTEER